MQLRHGQLAEVLLVPLLIITEVVPLLIITELVRRLPEAEDGCYFVFYICCYFVLGNHSNTLGHHSKTLGKARAAAAAVTVVFFEDYGLRAHMRLRA